MKRYLVLATTIFIAVIWTVPTQSVAEAPIVEIKQTPKEYAKAELEFRGYRDENWECLLKLWTKESNWNPKADNPVSTAFGIAQRLNETSTDPYTQIDRGLAYIEYRYGTPCEAWRMWLIRDKKGIGWY